MAGSTERGSTHPAGDVGRTDAALEAGDSGHPSGPSYVDADRTASPFASYETPHGSRYFQSLRRKLRWRLLVGYIAPFLLLSVYFHFQYTASLRAGIDAHLKSIADNQRNAVDLYLQVRTADLRRTLLGMDRFGPPAVSAIQGVLDELRADSPVFVDVGLFGPDGTLVSYAGPYPDLEGRSYAEEDWFKRVLEADSGSYISDVYLGFRREPHFIIAVTRSVEGRTWTLRASVDPAGFSQIVGGSHLVGPSDAFIVNVGGRPQSFNTTLDEARSVPLPRLPVGETRVHELSMDGTRYRAAVAPLRKSGWYLVVRAPESQAFAPVRRAGIVIGGLMLVTLVLVVVVALGSTQRLVGRLAAASSAQEDLRRQLFNAAKLASVGEMAAGVAHEINNPLAVIYEEAGMMLDQLDPRFGRQADMAEFRERLEAISQATLRGRNITRQLLAFSRRVEPEPLDLDLNALVRQALAAKTTEFAVSNIEIESRLADGLPSVHVDRNQMEQVLFNLLNNARDAIGDHGRIAVETSHEGKSVQLKVVDTGQGMPPELMEKIFFPFFTTKRVGKGTGLGLSISYGIVKSAGGRIEVESEVGRGTTFIITLPAGESSARQDPAAAERGSDG